MQRGQEGLDHAEIKPFRFLLWATFGLLLVFGIYIIGLLLLTWPISERSINKAASFGDSFGAITSLFAGLGFAGILATIFLQREELKLTRRELQETKKTLARQGFEDTFYRLIDLYRQNLEGVVIQTRSKPSRQLYGLDALSYLNDHFKHEWKRTGLEWPKISSRSDQIAYAAMLVSEIRGHYIRQTRYMDTLTNILELIKDEVEDKNLKAHYTRILCSQLTAQELIFVFYQAMINPDSHLLQRELCNNKAFIARVQMLRIPPDHRQAWNVIYNDKGTSAPNGRTRYEHPICVKELEAAKAEIKQLREVRRRSRQQRMPTEKP